MRIQSLKFTIEQTQAAVTKTCSLGHLDQRLRQLSVEVDNENKRCAARFA